MPAIVDYAHVLAHAQSMGLACVYYNSGSFGFAGDAPTHIVGWIGPADATIRADLPATLVRVPPPYPQELARRLTDHWTASLAGPAWLLPKSHWSFELGHGNGDWLRPALAAIGVDPADLALLTNAAAIVFEPGAAEAFRSLAALLLTRLTVSDFAVLFPQHPHLVTLHHHQQVWWQTQDATWAETLAARV